MERLHIWFNFFDVIRTILKKLFGKKVIFNEMDLFIWLSVIASTFSNGYFLFFVVSSRFLKWKKTSTVSLLVVTVFNWSSFSRGIHSILLSAIEITATLSILSITVWLLVKWFFYLSVNELLWKCLLKPRDLRKKKRTELSAPVIVQRYVLVTLVHTIRKRSKAFDSAD